MSKCWYCNNELTSEENRKHFGICDECYAEEESCGTVVIHTLTDKIGELQKQLKEKEKEIECYKHKDNISMENSTMMELKIASLEKQLKSQPAEIVEKIRKELGLKLKYKLNDEVSVLKICNQINEVLDTILKEYQK